MSAYKTITRTLVVLNSLFVVYTSNEHHVLHAIRICLKYLFAPKNEVPDGLVLIQVHRLYCSVFCAYVNDPQIGPFEMYTSFLLYFVFNTSVSFSLILLFLHFYTKLSPMYFSSGTCYIIVIEMFSQKGNELESVLQRLFTLLQQYMKQKYNIKRKNTNQIMQLLSNICFIHDKYYQIVNKCLKKGKKTDSIRWLHALFSV